MDKPPAQPKSSVDESPIRFRREAGSRDHFSGASGLLFEQAMAQTRMAICLTDPNIEDDPIVFCNRAFRDLTGYEEDEIVGRNCRFLQGPETDPDRVSLLRDAIKERRVIVTELLNYRKDGTTFWNALHIGPIFDDSGNLKYLFGSQWDVTDVHAARADEKHARMMARELSHRVKNMFAVISATVNMAARSKDQKDMADWITSRIRALGRAYETTLDEASSGSVDVGQMVHAVLEPYRSQPDRISLSGANLRLDANVISMLGLTLHELATNAVKYGALSAKDGYVDVSWEQVGGCVRIEWRERGGPAVDREPTELGSGVKIIRNLIRAADGSIDFDWASAGLEVALKVPLDDNE